MKASIVTATYNSAKRIDAVMDSFLVQDFDDFEIVVVNDGSADDTANALEKYRKRRNVVIINQKNKGAVSARNAGIKKARGEFIAVVDDDGILERRWLRKMVGFLGRNPHVGMAYSDIKNKKLENPSFVESLMYDYLMASRGAVNGDKESMMMCNCFRRSVFEQIGFYDERLGGAKTSGICADTEFAQRIRKRFEVLPVRSAEALHMEGNARFRVKFLIKKSIEWGRWSSYCYRKFNVRDSYLYISLPMPMLFYAALGAAAIFTGLFLHASAIAAITYVIFRRNVMINLLKRNVNPLKLLLIAPIDFARIMCYNIGNIKYFVKGRPNKRGS